MDIMNVIYITLFSVLGFAILLIVGIIAGRDIVLAFQRKFSQKGCEVYVAEDTRNITHYFLTPKDGVFKIDNLPYVTNPEKTMNLAQKDRENVLDSLFKRRQKLKKRIEEYRVQINTLEVQKTKVQLINPDDPNIVYINTQIERLKGIMVTFESKLTVKNENYFANKKPCFFYLKGDPVPKDFHEYYSALDSKMIDNLVSRSISQPPSKKQEQDLDKVMKFVLIAAGAAAITFILVFMNTSKLDAICQHLGLACSM